MLPQCSPQNFTVIFFYTCSIVAMGIIANLLTICAILFIVKSGATKSNGPGPGKGPSSSPSPSPPSHVPSRPSPSPGPKNSSTLDVTDFGAVGDGKTDDSQAFLKAWQALCGKGGQSNQILTIPGGKKFMLQPINFQGPCQTNSVQIQIEGDLNSPASPKEWDLTSGSPEESFSNGNSTWISFNGVNGLIITGSGTIDGRGAGWWSGLADSNAPSNLQFYKCNDVQISGITSLNSPRNHIEIYLCVGVSISNINIIAPEDSPNTDGIDISKSQRVKVNNSFIGTGDDCIAIKGFSSEVNITKVTCGPGHGISVGSIGLNGEHETVENIHVQSCTFNKTMYAARVKTSPGGSGYAKAITYKDITLIDAKNPILIDQYYCDKAKTCPQQPTSVKVSDVTFSGFQGTTSTKDAITLNCDAAPSPATTDDSAEGPSAHSPPAKSPPAKSPPSPPAKSPPASPPAKSPPASPPAKSPPAKSPPAGPPGKSPSAGTGGCSNIVLEDVTITPSTPGLVLGSVCNNVNGTSSSTVPSVPCLTKE